MNVKRKQKEKEMHKNKSLEGMRKKEGGGVGDQVTDVHSIVRQITSFDENNQTHNRHGSHRKRSKSVILSNQD